MITKERLEELIKNCAVIYGIEYNQIEIYDLSDTDICMSPANFRDYGLRVFNSLGYWNDIKFEDLFETKKEAEWYIEFGCIERTERLVLPTWEEFLELNRHCIEFHFITKEGDINYIVISDMYMHNDMLKPKDEWTIIIKDFDDEYIFEKPATKENYTLACRKAKELFLGEKK